MYMQECHQLEFIMFFFVVRINFLPPEFDGFHPLALARLTVEVVDIARLLILVLLPRMRRIPRRLACIIMYKRCIPGTHMID